MPKPPCRPLFLPFLLALAFFCLPCCHRAPAGSAAIGTRAFQFSNAGLAKAVVGQMWYPARPASREHTIFYSSMVWGRAAADAKPAKGAPRPLVLLAHGWRGTRFDLAWLGEALARRGYITAAINMPESDAASFAPSQAPKAWFRASMLSSVVDAVGHDARLGSLVDSNRVAVIGHSAGGSAALMLGGAQLDPGRFARLYPTAAPVVDGPWRDGRVRALVGLNPGTGPAFSAEGLAHVHVPVLILSGTKDAVAPEASNAGFYANHIEKASWTRFSGVDHYSFVSVCSPWGALRGYPTCTESAPEVNRRFVHAEALARILLFLGDVLPLSPDAAAPWPSVVPRLSPVAVRTAPAPSRT